MRIQPPVVELSHLSGQKAVTLRVVPVERVPGPDLEETAVEIQTFILAEKIVRIGPRRFDVQYAGLSAVVCPPEVEFPFRCAFPALILLRRESGSGDAPITLRLDLRDEDGHTIGFPRDLLGQGVFPAGERFLYLSVGIPFEFPAPGRYRLDITADEGLTGGVFHYNVEVGQQGEG